MEENEMNWEKITKLCEDVVDMKPDWVELNDMISEQVCTPSPDNDVRSLVHKFSFLTRMKYRLEKFEQAPFNRVSYSPYSRSFYIYNYDYATYMWAIKKGFTDGVNCNIIAIPEKDIDDKLKNKLMEKYNNEKEYQETQQD